MKEGRKTEGILKEGGRDQEEGRRKERGRNEGGLKED